MAIENFGQLISALAKKAGVEDNDQNLINVLSNAELTKVPVHGDLVKSLDENLLSVEAAKDNHPAIGSVYKAQALNGFDKAIAKIIDESEFDEEVKESLLGEKSTYKRFESLLNTIKAAQAAKTKSSSKEDKDAFQKQIDELQAALKAEKELLQSKEAEFKTTRDNDLKNYQLRILLDNHKTIFDDLDPNVRHTSLKSIIDKVLQDKELDVVLDENNQIGILRKDGTKLYGANNVAVSLNDVIDEAFAQNKVLKVSASPIDGGEQGGVPPMVVPPKSKPINGNNQAVADFNTKQAEALAQSQR